MIQEDKELLLKDLSARLPYRVKINVDDTGLFIPRLKYIDGITCHFYECAWTKFIDEIKPYLRPMSSMTEVEKETYQMFFNEDGLLNTSLDTYLDWLLEGQFDFRGLIPRGLALEAPEDMYKNQKV